jgi:hypothetical protein
VMSARRECGACTWRVRDARRGAARAPGWRSLLPEIAIVMNPPVPVIALFKPGSFAWALVPPRRERPSSAGATALGRAWCAFPAHLMLHIVRSQRDGAMPAHLGARHLPVFGSLQGGPGRETRPARSDGSRPGAALAMPKGPITRPCSS